MGCVKKMKERAPSRRRFRACFPISQHVLPPITFAALHTLCSACALQQRLCIDVEPQTVARPRSFWHFWHFWQLRASAARGAPVGLSSVRQWGERRNPEIGVKPWLAARMTRDEGTRDEQENWDD